MDLLVDPEMEFRFGGSASMSSAPRRSLSEESIDRFQFSVENEPDPYVTDADDSYSFTEDSAEITCEDHLQSTFADKAAEKDSKYTRNISRSFTVKKSSLSSSRSKFGKSLKDSPPTSENDENEPFSSNLLWVPADQHPNVKLENYLELVTDTLHNLQLVGREQLEKNPNSNYQLSQTNSTSAHEAIPSKNSLVRKPSRLRKSFTEAENIDDPNSDEDLNTETPISKRKRVSSLKEITEELTRISNNAGLTDSDAITLARTLGIGTPAATDRRNFTNTDVASNDEIDEEYASNILTKNGLSISQGSSLRRSKFATYRIRSPSGDSLPLLESGSLLPSLPEYAQEQVANHLKDAHVFKEGQPPQSWDASITPQSPNSINDIYDHYNTTDTDEYVSDDLTSPSTQMSGASYTVSPAQVSCGHSKKDTYAISSSTTSPSSNPPIDATSTSSLISKSPIRTIPANLPAKDSTKSREKKKPGWNWFNNKRTPSETDNSDSNSDQLQFEKGNSNENFPAVSVQSAPSPERVDRKVNHSRNRHKLPSPEMAIMHTSEALVEKLPPAEPGQDLRPQQRKKKEKLEKKFMKIFKKKAAPGQQNVTTSLHQPLDGAAKSKVKSSHEHKRPYSATKKENGRRSAADHPNIPKIHGSTNTQYTSSEPILDNNISRNLNGASDLALSKPTNDVAILQPAVNVKSSKDSPKQENHSTPVRSVNDKLQQKLQQPQVDPNLNASGPVTSSQPESSIGPLKDENQGVEFGQRDGLPTKLLSASQKPESSPNVEQNDSLVRKISEPEYALPPRELTFDDVIRPEKPNSPMKFTPSAFGFPLPPLTISTVIMFDHRLPIYAERAIYRLSHLKLSDPKRELRQQVLLSNFMYSYLNLVNHSLYLQQIEEEKNMGMNT
ncbi:uncharacterized protein Ecym_2710 [Eremothecium cymbalariae DBVPG|uniref:Protein Zds1 C-terminal domain-containing protein n=1 Tax=Eremothecium cymbalariae (strain CBS 270.75 / DBVPG 7215 / KCTC 17166 / NRRL Y-17582) TaxID=931890 RepID=G8JPE9_ERECY|nr:Hypothetical protein Ecym_2710 [Eremothecium cymbalariae DBVPG\